MTGSASHRHLADAGRPLTSAKLAATRAAGRLTAAFRTGEELGWHEHHGDLFAETERFFRPGYLANLTTSWLRRRTAPKPSSAAAREWPKLPYSGRSAAPCIS